ncbi:16S rRNA (uracil(1498)-N(3))-methyltransferase [Pedomonas mirosovicensis]|uniref:16S rRNA (uracil(1498)-N(3))-methyltransferase n=1 Tax=Pedomonas mirosovicensis TaxID=2908641 RepID=UPI002169E8DF|nr:16S rRNA (uracil(1498)-N(3))-methyltransferase [Pedomonas mirosovicensis]MCH8686026.1 16S rRNA (uracil(1498)-N(3))-methyltransferase [Pedomonas mirosovicensis]
MSKPLVRLYVSQHLGDGASVALSREASHYLIEVMRMQAGDTVALFDGETGEWEAVIDEPHRKQARLSIRRQLRVLETVPDLWLLFAPIKRGRIDFIVEKACELGVARAQPVITQRTIVDRVPLDRLHANMVEAAEQCGRTALPTLAEPVQLEKLLADWPEGRALLFCDETGGQPMLEALKDRPRGTPAAILIGPEGGFTDAERQMIRALPSAVPLSLGPRILRADTAAVAAISLWQAAQGDWA